MGETVAIVFLVVLAAAGFIALAVIDHGRMGLEIEDEARKSLLDYYRTASTCS